MIGHQHTYSLNELKIEVTHRCSMSCIHCSSDATPDCTRQMDIENCIRIIREAMSLGAKEVIFSGGEPLLWPSLESAIQVASTSGAFVTIYTTGIAPEARQQFYLLKNAGLKKAVFSIFGSSSEVHERITRMRGSFERTIAALKYALELNLEVELHFVPLSINFRELSGVGRMAQKTGIRRISVLRFVPQGRGYLYRRHLLNRMENLELRDTILKLRADGIEIRTGSPYNFLLINDKPSCKSGVDRLIVGPDFRIYPCDAFKQIKAEELVGTSHLSIAKNVSLKECWEQSPFLLAVRKHLATGFAYPCNSCKDLSRCLSGCLAQKVIATGKLVKQPDPMCLRQN